MSGRADQSSVLCVGRLYCDLIFTGLPRMPTTGTEVFSKGVGLHAGGGAAITAGHLSSLGHRTALAARLPAGAFGDLIAAELAGFGVDLGHCERTPDGSDPQMTVALVHDGERAFVTHREGPAFGHLDADDLVAGGIRHVHIGEAATLVDHPELIDIARAANASLSLDCGWDDDMETEALARLLPEVDVFLPNADEVAFLHRSGLSDPLARLTVVKQGKRGATALTSHDEIHAPALPAEVVDTTGAGDAFNAAFLSAWLGEASLRTCLERGNARGAAVVAHKGGLGGPCR